METIRDRNIRVREILAVAIVAIVGTSLAFQNWKSRIPSGTFFDVVTIIDEAHQLVENGRVPQKGVLTSFAAFAPPGGVWLMAPGVLLLKDPRLFQSIGSVTLYCGTLLGIFLLTRFHLGSRCALLAVLLWGLSKYGLFFASSLWPRGHPFFFIWMLYWVSKWVQCNSPKFLFAAILTWAIGVYVFLEIAPAIIIVPAAWILHRPSSRVAGAVLGAGFVAAIVWYPYLRFEYGRNFIDLKSQILRQSIWPINFQESWCNPTVVPEGWRQKIVFQDLESRRVPSLPWWLRLKNGIVERAFVDVGLLANFMTSSDIPGAGFALLGLTLAGLLNLWIDPSTGSERSVSSLKWSQRLKWLALGIVLSGLVLNQSVAALLSADGMLEESTFLRLRIVRVALVVVGAALFLVRNKLVAALVNRAVPSTSNNARNPKLLAIGLTFPWLLLLCVSERVERFWWLWPLLVIVLASSVTYLASRLRMPRYAFWVGALGLVIALVPNTWLMDHVYSWASDGWAGQDTPAIAAMGHLGTLLQSQGRNEARIGYEIQIQPFMAAFNHVDPRYKVGADLDLWLKYRRGVTNRNECAEGISDADEYRVVETNLSDKANKFRYSASRDDQFHETQQFKSYTVLERR